MSKCYGYAGRSGFEISNGVDQGKDKRYSIGFLGRIYNKPQLRDHLTKCGFNIENDSDVTIVYNSYLKWHENFTEHINGSFLISIFDRQTNCLLLVRDHFGKYPLYFTKFKECFYFSSDVDLLFSEYSVPKSIDPQSLNYYFAIRYVPQDRTIFKNIKKQPVASMLKYDIDSNSLEVESYWSFSDHDPVYRNEDELAEELEEVLLQSIKSRYSDSLKTGAFLSGGIDSSLVVAMLSKILPGPVKTFSIGFKENEFDESKYSAMITSHFGTEHHIQIMDPSVTEHFDSLGSFFPEPIGDPSAIPTYYSCKLASEHAKNVFCGEGADCLFLGMNTHNYTYNYSRLYDRANPLVHLLTIFEKFIPEESKWKILFEGLTPEQFFIRRSVLFNEKQRSNLLSGQVIDSLGSDISFPEQAALRVLQNYKGSIKGKMSYHNATTEVDNTIAMRILLAGAFSLFYSTPFMDVNVANFVSRNVHPDLRLNNGVRKYLLKKVAIKYLPSEFPMNRKRGFNPPIGNWLRNDWWQYTREKILDVNDGLINRQYTESLLNKHKNHDYDQGNKLFSILMLRLWQESKNIYS